MLLLKETLKFLGSCLRQNERQDNEFSLIPVLCEHTRLIHRLECIQLNDDEVKCLQAYLTLILEARYQNANSASSTADSSDCIVVEMAQEELQKFTRVVGGNGIQLFRALVRSDDSKTSARKLAIVGQNGIRLFNVLVHSGV
jgi:hypothetical protein